MSNSQHRGGQDRLKRKCLGCDSSLVNCFLRCLCDLETAFTRPKASHGCSLFVKSVIPVGKMCFYTVKVRGLNIFPFLLAVDHNL